MTFKSLWSVEILLYVFTNEARAKVPTLSFLEQANIFAVGEQKDKQSEKSL
jgi:hypothetical protein